MKSTLKRDVVLRYTDKYEGVDTIKEHAAIAKAQGAVWIGKIGRGLGADSIKKLREQCASVDTKLYMVRRVNAEYECFESKLLDICADLPSKDKGMVPQYYKDNNIMNFVLLWLKVDGFQRVDSQRVRELVVPSGLNLVDALQKRALLQRLAEKFETSYDTCFSVRFSDYAASNSSMSDFQNSP